jgi:hypothetical protein
MKVPRTILTCFFVLALTAFLFGLTLHAFTYAGVDARDSIPKVWYSFQIATALLFIPLVITGRRDDPRLQRKFIAPKFLLACVGVFMLYAFINWTVTEMFLTHGQTPEILNGKYVLTSHGHATQISYSDFLKYKAWEARAFSSHWMALWGFAAIWLCDHLVTRTEKLRFS